MRQVSLPAPTWSVRAFPTEDQALAFYGGLYWNGFEPTQLTEDMLGPDGDIIGAGRWLVVYQVFE